MGKLADQLRKEAEEDNKTATAQRRPFSTIPVGGEHSKNKTDYIRQKPLFTGVDCPLSDNRQFGEDEKRLPEQFEDSDYTIVLR
jgi:hypothetical protein